MTFHKALVIGCNGQLGKDMMLTLSAREIQTVGFDYPEIDITALQSVRDRIVAVSPDVVINCAAYTAVDACETNEDTAYRVNATGAANCAQCAEQAGARFVHISTDYVFDGLKQGAYTEDDPVGPLSAYGRTKLEGERLVCAASPRALIFRIAWLYGNRGANFVKTIRKIALDKSTRSEPLKVVTDQIGSPTYTIEVCKQIADTIASGHYGLYHCTAEGWCSWYEFAQAIIAAYKINVAVLPCSTEEFPRPARRPPNSVLENARLKQLGINRMKYWREAFDDFLSEERDVEPKGDGR